MTLDLTTLEASLKRDEELAERATPGPWEVQDGCSWRRIGTTWESPRGSRDGNVLCPYNARSDGHPDLTAGRGEDTQANLTFIAHARTALLDRVKDCRELFFALEHSEAAAEGHKTDAEFWEHNFREQQAKATAADSSLAEAVRALQRVANLPTNQNTKKEARRIAIAALSTLQPRKDTP